jgi:hypothetical protein
MSDEAGMIAGPGHTTIVQDNIAEYYFNFGSAPSGKVHRGPDPSWVISAMPSPTFNSVVRTRLSEADVEPVAEKVVEEFRE